MADSLTTENAQFTLAVLEVLLYGLSLLMLFITLWTLLHRKKLLQINRRILSFTVLLFAFQTMYTAVGIRRRYQGFVSIRDTYPGGAAAFFENVTTNAIVLRNVAWDFQVALGDAIVIWRAYVVWQSIWVVLLPIAVWVGFVVSASGELSAMRNTKPSITGLFAADVEPWSNATLACTLACNLIATSLLAYRLWKMEQETISSNLSKTEGRQRTSRIRPVLVVVVDAGILYSVWVLIAFICDLKGFEIEYVFDNSLPSIVSITFYMVLLRLAWLQNVRSGASKYPLGGTGTMADTSFDPRTQLSAVTFRAAQNSAVRTVDSGDMDVRLAPFDAKKEHTWSSTEDVERNGSEHA